MALATLLTGQRIVREALVKRIAHTDPAKYERLDHVHGGAGELRYESLLKADDFNTNLLFLHRGVLLPKSGIGHHYHNQMEEMFVILDNEAQFTIDGRTSRLIGPAGAPCRMGHSHAIYNPTNRPTQWMNIAVASAKGKYDNFDLDDDRVGSRLDPKPVFVTLRLDEMLLQPVQHMHGGRGIVRYRRALHAEVFFTNWAYVDHLVLAPGSSVGPHRHTGVEELYYVMSGEGSTCVNGETAGIRVGDAIPVLLNETVSFENRSTQDLQFLLIGVAQHKGDVD